MKTIILSITDSDKHFSTAIMEYIKRLGKQIEIKNIKPIKHISQRQTIQQETILIMNILQDKFSAYKKILLSKEGKQINTYDFVKYTSFQKLVFIIGGPYGLDEKMLTKGIDAKLSFGAMTMPHGLVKLVLLEQLYRAETIRIGKKYHY